MDKTLFLILLPAIAIFTPPSLEGARLRSTIQQPNGASMDKEEAFLVRRIAEFWKDQDYEIVKIQIQDFLQKYPKSSMREELQGILGDLYLQENRYQEALNLYSSIKSSDLKSKIIVNQLQCHYELSDYSGLLKSGSTYLKKPTADVYARIDEYHFLMAEGYFREASQYDDKQTRLAAYKSAKPLYESIEESAFKGPAQFALAEIYAFEGDHVKAAHLFLELADKHPQQSDELTFRAGLSQSEFDKEAALVTFTQLTNASGSKAVDASLNRLILLYQLEKYEDVIEQFHNMHVSVDQDKKVAFHYIVGRSYYSIGKYAEASASLSDFTTLADKTSSEYRNALLLQMSCAKELQDQKLYTNSLDAFQMEYPNDNGLPRALFIQGLMQKEEGKTLEAESTFERLLTEYPDFEENESLYLEYCLVCHTNGNWNKSYTILRTFLQQYPRSEHAGIARKYYLAACINLLKQSEEDINFPYQKEHFVEDLSEVLASNCSLEITERNECEFVLAKVNYELGRFSKALTLFNEYLESYSTGPHLAQTHLYIALCHHELGGGEIKFCEHAEKALSLDPSLQNRSALQIELFNVYLSRLSEEKNPTRQAEFTNAAATNLFEAYATSAATIKDENKLWLADFYFNQLKKPASLFEVEAVATHIDNPEIANRAEELLNNVLVSKSTQRLISLTKEQTSFEWEVLKYASLLSRKGQTQDRLILLRDLIEQQNRHEDWNWQLRKEALLELGKTYEDLGDKENAIDTFAFVANHFSNDVCFATKYAELHAARIRFEQMPTEQRHEEHPKVRAILNDLKELQIKKHVQSEPIHLEASLEYAWIRAHLSGEKNGADRYIFFLERIKEDYTNYDDPIVAAYHDHLDHDAAKKEIYVTYIKFLEAELLRAQGKNKMLSQKTAEAEELNSKALDLLVEVKEKDYTTYYLHNRIAKSIDAINRQNLY